MLDSHLKNFTYKILIRDGCNLQIKDSLIRTAQHMYN